MRRISERMRKVCDVIREILEQTKWTSVNYNAKSSSFRKKITSLLFSFHPISRLAYKFFRISLLWKENWIILKYCLLKQPHARHCRLSHNSLVITQWLSESRESEHTEWKVTHLMRLSIVPLEKIKISLDLQNESKWIYRSIFNMHRLCGRLKVHGH